MWQIAINAFACLRYPGLICQYVRNTGRCPNVAVPGTIEEKYLWRKIFDTNPLFPQLCDKLRVKEYVASRCPDLLVPETLWVGTNWDDIPENMLAVPAVLKSNHASGHLVFLNGQAPDRARLKKLTDRWLARPYGQKNGEWGYRDIDRKLFVEELIQGDSGEPLEDFNAYVMNGKVQHMHCLRERHGRNPTTSRYDREGNQFEAQHSATFTAVSVDPPAQYQKIVELAERLGAGFDHMRCDFYLCSGQIYFSEMTVYSAAGFPESEGRLRTAWTASWDLRQSWFLTAPQSGWRGAYARWLWTVLGDAAVPTGQGVT
ncbi:MAG: ATP-grasp fold amidoligase family protein [Pseudomonadota bacterium]